MEMHSQCMHNRIDETNNKIVHIEHQYLKAHQFNN